MSRSDAETVRAAVAAAVAEAKRMHEAGRCGESEWSCSWCAEGEVPSCR